MNFTGTVKKQKSLDIQHKFHHSTNCPNDHGPSHETLVFLKDRILFVGAHWDTYGLSPGFDDNGSGKEERSEGTVD